MKRSYNRTRFFTSKLLALGCLMWFAAVSCALIVGVVAAGLLAIAGRDLSWVGGQVVLGLGFFLGFALYMGLVLLPAARERRRILDEEWATSHPDSETAS